MRNYTQIVNDIKQSVIDLEERGITVKPLNEAISELLLHTENLGKIEDNLDSIRLEVISPIKRELDENKKSGKFSIFGFYVGSLGLLVSIVAIFFSTPFFSNFSNRIFHSSSTDGTIISISLTKYRALTEEGEKLKDINNRLNKGLIDASGIENTNTEFIYQCREKIQ